MPCEMGTEISFLEPVLGPTIFVACSAKNGLRMWSSGVNPLWPACYVNTISFVSFYSKNDVLAKWFSCD